jgi:hypothetical protein
MRALATDVSAPYGRAPASVSRMAKAQRRELTILGLGLTCAGVSRSKGRSSVREAAGREALARERPTDSQSGCRVTERIVHVSPRASTREPAASASGIEWLTRPQGQWECRASSGPPRARNREIAPGGARRAAETAPPRQREVRRFSSARFDTITGPAAGATLSTVAGTRTRRMRQPLG